MKAFVRTALAAAAALTLVGTADAMPIAPQSVAVTAPVVKAAVIVTTRRVVRRPIVRRRVVTTRVIRRVIR